MAKNKKPKWKKKVGFFVLVRNYTAIISTWLMNLGMFGVTFRSVCTPGFNCHGCPWATSACPIGVATFGSALHVLPAMAIATILAVGALLGRLVCAFLCPFGLFQELMFRIPGRKFRLPRFTRYLKYVALVALVFVLPFWLGFKQGGYLRIETAQFQAVDDLDLEEEESEEEEDSEDTEEEDQGEEESTEEEEAEDVEDEEDTEEEDAPEQVQVTLTVTNLGDEAVTDPVAEIILHQKAKTKDGAPGPEVGRLQHPFPGVVVAPGETRKLPPFRIEDTREKHILYADSPQSRVEQTPRYDLYYCKVCPIGTLEATVPRMVRETEKSWGQKIRENGLKLGITAFFLVLMVFVSRPFCRMFCPLGATYALLSKVSVSGMKFDQSKCGGCGLCVKVCPVDIDPTREVGGRDCILCGDCIKVCPKGAIQRTFGLSFPKSDYRTFELKGKKKPDSHPTHPTPA